MLFYDLKQYENNIAVIDENDHQYSYRELNQMVMDFTNLLSREKKSLILIRCRNDVESLIGYLGGLSSDNVVLLVDYSIDDELLENIIRSYQPEYIWQPFSNGQACIARYKNYELLATGYQTEHQLFSSLGLLMLTSGSTGAPKGVRLTTASVNANAKSIAHYLKLNTLDKAITNLPMSYAYGLSVINSHLYVGATLLLTNYSIIKKEFWDFFKKYEATSLTGVPYTYEMLKTLGFFNMQLPSLKYFTQAGGKLRADLIMEYADFSRNRGLDFFVMYGQTEATARISYLPPAYNVIKNKSIGIAIPDGNLILKDDKGNLIEEAGTEGVLHYQGPNVMLGYAYKRDDLANGDDLQGELNTNDIAYFDEDGFFYIIGRNSRFIKVSGKRINLEEIEHYLRKNEIDCAVGGYDELLVVVVTDISHTGKIREIVIKKFKLDYDNLKICAVKEIKKNKNGKIDYKTIFAKYQGGKRECLKI